MSLYVLVLTALLCSLQVKSYPYLEEPSSQYEEQVEGPRLPYDQQFDEIVKEMTACMNATLTESGVLNKLDSDHRLLMERIGLFGIISYIEHMFEYLNGYEENEARSNEEVKELDHKEEFASMEDFEYSSESEEYMHEHYM